MISLIIPPKSQISQVAKMLADEYGTASNIKSRVNRYSQPFMRAHSHSTTRQTAELRSRVCVLVRLVGGAIG